MSENLKNVLKAIPKEVHPMNLMQTAVAALGALEGENEDFSDQDEKIIRLLEFYRACFVIGIIM